ncbi:hypothetical protein [Ensifer sp. LCM 4579]|uniref:hypothetical protein n=1 Tax=Ensifer sp. LCM 4579 TaxID=1848292 RepID=UPI0008DB2852|nr:hypothetical protein [Ensifer sp. LCM 4579]OHV85919.1 hypothetical protein LCM4579_00730 [Ensifer sp. LCM 4579]
MSIGTPHRAAIAAFNKAAESIAMSEILPFRVHFHDPLVEPIDVRARNSSEARQLATTRRSLPDGAVRKIKVIREKADG